MSLSQGPFRPHAAVSAAPGAVAWADPTFVENNIFFATASAGFPYVTEQLQATDFSDFAIPLGAIIRGIVFSTNKTTTDTTNSIDNTVQLMQGGVAVGDNKADLINGWPSPAAVTSYGASNDLWGVSWTPSDINDSGFGVLLAGETTDSGVGLDCTDFLLTVYYDLIPSLICSSTDA